MSKSSILLFLALPIVLSGCLEEGMVFDASPPWVKKGEKQAIERIPASATTREKAMAVIQNHCSICHVGYHLLSDAQLKSVWIGKDRADSALIRRIMYGKRHLPASQQNLAQEDMPKNIDTGMTTEDTQLVVLYVDEVIGMGSSSSSSGGSSTSSTSSTSSGGSSTSSTSSTSSGGSSTSSTSSTSSGGSSTSSTSSTSSGGSSTSSTSSTSSSGGGMTMREKAMDVIKNHCSSCHTGYHLLTDQQFRAVWVGSTLESSALITRIKYGDQFVSVATLGDMPKNVDTGLSVQHVSSIVDWINDINSSSSSSSTSSGGSSTSSTSSTSSGGSSSTSSSSGGSSATIQRSPRLSGRLILSSQLHQIFGAAAKSDVDALITSRATIFGDPCGVKEESTLATCTGLDSSDPGLALGKLQSNTVVEGQKTKACDVLVFKHGAYAIQLATGKDALSFASNPIPTQQDIYNLYQLFYPGHVPASSVANELDQLAQAARTGGETGLGPSTAVLLAICYSGWHAM